MLFIRPLLQRRTPAVACRGSLQQWRQYSTPKPEYQPPASAENPHRAFYQSWGIPVIKVFLGALFTYQVIYLGWLKLEELENQHSKDEETKILEGRLAELTNAKPSKLKS